MIRITIAIALALFATTATAGQAEYDAAVRKARLDHAAEIKWCAKLPADEVQPCVKRVDGYLANAVKGFKAAHLPTPPKGAKK